MSQKINRRKFLQTSSLIAAGGALLTPFKGMANGTDLDISSKYSKAKNIIFLISDGMSTGTLNMADLYLNRQTGKGSNWMELYKNNEVSRALMDTASASSIVTDSSAASSAFGGGVRVKNGKLNIGPNKERYLPIWQKFKKAGKMAGCVTTVTITHATPAGFCVNNDSRNAESEIAEMYLDLEFDLMMGGGDEFFNKQKRKDKKDVYANYHKKGYQVLKNRQDLLNVKDNKPILGVFCEGALPYSIDRNNSKELSQEIPTLAEMTQTAINKMKEHPEGFVLQVEGGKVDWSAHANDISALIHDQIAFDEAIKIAIDFAKQNKETLVIITTDHGNANPGVIYGKSANDDFDSIAKYTHTNEWILNQINNNFSIQQLIDIIQSANSFSLTSDEAKQILSYYDGLKKEEEGLYNYKKLPFKTFSEIQKKHNSVGWISMNHSADYVELAAYGPGKELLKPFVKNTDIHYLLLEAAQIENVF